MAFIYTRSELKSLVNSEIQNRQGMLVDFDILINRGVRNVFGGTDLLTAQRKVTLTPNLYNGIFDYAMPSDFDKNKIIDVPAQAKRQDGEFFFVPSTEFDIHRQRGMIAIEQQNGSRVLRIVSQVDSKTLVASTMDSLNAGAADGTDWTAFGDAETLARDDADFIRGSGSIKWNIDASGGTTAGIQHINLNPIDITDFLGGTSSWFVWHEITDPDNITNYKLRFGDDVSNYREKTITTQHDGTAFVLGWNLLRFDIVSLTTVGTPTDVNKYFVIHMTKTTGKVSESDYKFDHLMLKKGVVHNLRYYTRFGWQTSAGAYIRNSTLDSDLLVADESEFELITLECTKLALREVRDHELARESEREFKEKRKEYLLNNPSESKIMSYEYHNYGPGHHHHDAFHHDETFDDHHHHH